MYLGEVKSFLFIKIQMLVVRLKLKFVPFVVLEGIQMNIIARQVNVNIKILRSMEYTLNKSSK